MLARRLLGISVPPSSGVHSVAGLIRDRDLLVEQPFRLMALSRQGSEAIGDGSPGLLRVCPPALM